jgi:hypothetical protein
MHRNLPKAFDQEMAYEAASSAAEHVAQNMSRVQEIDIVAFKELPGYCKLKASGPNNRQSALYKPKQFGQSLNWHSNRLSH